MEYRRILNVSAWDLRVGDTILNDKYEEVKLTEKHLDHADGTIHLEFDNNADGLDGLFCDPIATFMLVYSKTEI